MIACSRRKYFKQYGKIQDSYLSQSGTVNKSYQTSYAFVTYENKEDAIRAHNCEMDRVVSNHVLNFLFCIF